MKIDEVLSLVRPHLRDLQPYSSARDEFDQSNVGKVQYTYLDANENPFNTEHNRYPDPHQHELKKKIAEIKNVDTNQIFLGNGSDEAIDLIIRLFCNESDTIVIPYPTYGMYEVSAKINNVKLKKFLLDENFALPPDVSEEGKIIFLCSPNNPSGNLLDVEPILKSFKGIVVVDEAYIDFTDKPGYTTKLEDYPNLIVLQTFSKAWGLAGLRLGMAFAHPQIISLINKIKPPYNISSATQKLAAQAFAKIDDVKKMVVAIKGERKRVAKELTKLTTVRKVFPSEANFVLVRIDKAAKVYDKLINDHIVVRDRSKVQRCEDCLRITIGTPDENNRLLEALLKYS
jgi:histidinol-phosphate aminotransferase